MGASRLKPLTVKEVEKLTSVRPTSIKHRFLGGVPGFVLVHTPSGYTSYGLVYRSKGERKKLTLGCTKTLTLGEARALAGKHWGVIEGGGDPHGDKVAERQQIQLKRNMVLEREQLGVELLWEKYMQLVASQLRSRGEKERIFRRYILPKVLGLLVSHISKRHVLEIIDPLVRASCSRRFRSRHGRIISPSTSSTTTRRICRPPSIRRISLFMGRPYAMFRYSATGGSAGSISSTGRWAKGLGRSTSSVIIPPQATARWAS